MTEDNRDKMSQYERDLTITPPPPRHPEIPSGSYTFRPGSEQWGLINPCWHCDGKGGDTCDACSGLGGTDCPACLGSGLDDGHQTCPACGGDGDVACTECDEGGLMQCSQCKGAGHTFYPLATDDPLPPEGWQEGPEPFTWPLWGTPQVGDWVAISPTTPTGVPQAHLARFAQVGRVTGNSFYIAGKRYPLAGGTEWGGGPTFAQRATPQVVMLVMRARGKDRKGHMVQAREADKARREVLAALQQAEQVGVGPLGYHFILRAIEAQISKAQSRDS